VPVEHGSESVTGRSSISSNEGASNASSSARSMPNGGPFGFFITKK
jgi:hypothetical protein